MMTPGSPEPSEDTPSERRSKKLAEKDLSWNAVDRESWEGSSVWNSDDPDVGIDEKTWTLQQEKNNREKLQHIEDTRARYEAEYANNESDDGDDSDDHGGLPPGFSISKFLATCSWAKHPSRNYEQPYIKAIKRVSNSLIKKTGRTNKQLSNAWTPLMGGMMEMRRKRRDIASYEALMDALRYNATQPGNNPTSINSATSLSNPTGVVQYGAMQTLAHLKYRYIFHYVLQLRVLHELKTLRPSFKPKSVMDYGCGAGGATLAALRVFGGGEDGEGSVESVRGIDVSMSQREAYEYMVDGVCSTFEERVDRVEEEKEEDGVVGGDMPMWKNNHVRISTDATIGKFLFFLL